MQKITINTTIQVPITNVYNSYLDAEDNKQWNTAGGGWTTGKTSIDATVGGRWATEYISPDGTNNFVFGGTYTEITPNPKIAYAMNPVDKPISPEDRRVEVLFAEVEIGKSTQVTVIFDPENENAIAFQKAGWQNILNNFKQFIEKTNK